jgi:hypothetical protein
MRPTGLDVRSLAAEFAKVEAKTRAGIVAWLLRQPDTGASPSAAYYARRIERGDDHAE